MHHRIGSVAGWIGLFLYLLNFQPNQIGIVIAEGNNDSFLDYEDVNEKVQKKFLQINTDGTVNEDEERNVFEVWYELAVVWEWFNWTESELEQLPHYHHSDEHNNDTEQGDHRRRRRLATSPGKQTISDSIVSSLWRSLLASEEDDSDDDEHDDDPSYRRLWCKLSDSQLRKQEFVEAGANDSIAPYNLKQVEHAAFVLYKATKEQVHLCDNEHHFPKGAYYVLYAAFVLLLGCLLRWGTHRYDIPIPYTVSLLVVGFIFEWVFESIKHSNLDDLGAGFSSVSRLDPHIILVLFIPGLIFESAFNTNYHIFLKEKEQSLMLAGPGVIMNTLITGGVMHYFNNYDWFWSFSFMFGAIVSATDPVAVVALLGELGASKRLSTLIEAESLLNDGTAFVLYVMLAEYASAPEDSREADPWNVVAVFFQLAIGGALWGLAVGILLFKSLQQVFNDFQVEISLTLGWCYLGFYYGDVVAHVSGVLACVFLGLYTSKNRQSISPNVEHVLHHFWEMVGFGANTTLFFMTGQVIAFKIIGAATEGSGSILARNPFYHFGITVMLYFMVHVSRALTIWCIFPVLEETGYGCTWKDASVMVYGGLRGAIGLALALLVESEPGFTDDQKDLVLLHVSGVVVLTLVVNASTIKYLVEYLELNKPPADTIGLFNTTVEHLNERREKKLAALQRDLHYKGANWLSVRNLQPRYEKLMQQVYGENYLEHLRRAKAVHNERLDDPELEGLMDSGEGNENDHPIEGDGHHTTTQTGGADTSTAAAATDGAAVSSANAGGGSITAQTGKVGEDDGRNTIAAAANDAPSVSIGINEKVAAMRSDINNNLFKDDEEVAMNRAGFDQIHHTEAFSGLHIIDLLEAVAREERHRCEMREVEKRVIQVMKASYWSQYEGGLISADAVNVLVEAAETAIDQHDLIQQMYYLEKYFSIPDYVKVMHESKYSWVTWLSHSLLFSSLGFAIEVSSGLVYATKAATKFCITLRRQKIFDEDLIKEVQTQLNSLAKFTTKKMENVENVYPEVHEAIQTSHAAHALLHAQKHEIDHLKHAGYLDDADYGRFSSACDVYLQRLFRSNYSVFLSKDASDEREILVNCPLFSSLTMAERDLLRNNCVTRMLGQEVIFESGQQATELFVITRGHVKVVETAFSTVGSMNSLGMSPSSAPLSPVSNGNGGHHKAGQMPAKTARMAGTGEALEHLSRGDVFAVYPFLTCTAYQTSYMGVTEKVHGFKIPFQVIQQLSRNNVDFATDMWKRAAVEIIEYLFRDHELFQNYEFGDGNSVESFVYSENTRIGFYCGLDDYNAQMRLNKGPGVLLQGTAVSPGRHEHEYNAPDVMHQHSRPYVAVTDVCVVLHIVGGSKRRDRHSAIRGSSALRDISKATLREKKSKHAAGKLDKLFGLSRADEEESLDSASSMTSSSDTDSSSLSGDSDNEADDELAAEMGVVSRLESGTIKRSSTVGFSAKPPVTKTLSVSTDRNASVVTTAVSLDLRQVSADQYGYDDGKDQLMDGQVSGPGGMYAQSSLEPPGTPSSRTTTGTRTFSSSGGRRSRRQHRHRHHHARYSLELKPEVLPKDMDLTMDKRTAFEVIKHLMAKHELFRETDVFHVHHTRMKHSKSRRGAASLGIGKRQSGFVPAKLLKSMTVDAVAEDREHTAHEYAAHPLKPVREKEDSLDKVHTGFNKKQWSIDYNDEEDGTTTDE